MILSHFMTHLFSYLECGKRDDTKCVYVYLMVGLKAYSKNFSYGTEHYYVTIVMKFNPFVMENGKLKTKFIANRISLSHTSL